LHCLDKVKLNFTEKNRWKTITEDLDLTKKLGMLKKIQRDLKKGE